MKLRLVPVVEFEPSALGVENFCELQDLGKWPEHWSGVLAELGLRSIQPGSWFVACSELRAPAAFEALVRLHLTESLDSIPETDALSPIAGGYVFSVDESIQLEPGCCCDLSNVAAWRGAFREGERPTRLTIGHGCYSLVTEDAATIVTIDPETTGRQSLSLRYPAPDFERALDHAELEQRAFAESLKSYLSRVISTERLDEVVTRLVFGSQYPSTGSGHGRNAG
jgi:hypothetical protein